MAKTAAKTLVAVTLLSFVALPAFSRDTHDKNYNDQEQNYHGRHDASAPEIESYRDGHHVSAPEIDPGQALGAFALLAGTVAIVSRHRRKK